MGFNCSNINNDSIVFKEKALGKSILQNLTKDFKEMHQAQDI